MVVVSDKDRCLRCGGCVGVCPQLALDLTEHGIICSDKCISCKICISFCPMGALRLKGDG